MQGGHVLITMAVVDQIQFQPFHQRCDGKSQLDGLGRFEGDAEILAMPGESEPDGLVALQHGGAAMVEGP